MRWFGTLARIVGWLLTPLVAWAVSLGAAWVLLGFSGGFDNPRHALYAALAAAFAPLLAEHHVPGLAVAAEHLRRAGVPFSKAADRITVDAADAFGVTIGLSEHAGA